MKEFHQPWKLYSKRSSLCKRHLGEISVRTLIDRNFYIQYVCIHIYIYTYVYIYTRLFIRSRHQQTVTLGWMVNRYFKLIISSEYCKMTAKLYSQPLQHPTTNKQKLEIFFEKWNHSRHLTTSPSRKPLGWWSHQPLPRCPFQGKQQGSQSFQDP